MGNNIRGGKMQRIQLIALDLDGTLLNDSKEVSNESTDAVRKLISRGIYVVPTSGRSSNDELFVEKLTTGNQIFHWRKWRNNKGLYGSKKYTSSFNEFNGSL